MIDDPTRSPCDQDRRTSHHEKEPQPERLARVRRELVVLDREHKDKEDHGQAGAKQQGQAHESQARRPILCKKLMLDIGRVEPFRESDQSSSFLNDAPTSRHDFASR